MSYHVHLSLFDPDGQRKCLNHLECQQFYEIANARPRMDVRLFCLLLYYTGARISEIINLKPISIDFANKSVAIRTLKRRRNDVFRQIPLPDALMTDIRNYIKAMGKCDQLWRFAGRSASRYVKSVMQEAGIDDAKSSALGLRHGFAVHAVQKVPITQVQKWLGHAQLQTTAIYLNVSGFEERELAKLLWKD
jgi:integrase